jgi:hypothetical protein
MILPSTRDIYRLSGLWRSTAYCIATAQVRARLRLEKVIMSPSPRFFISPPLARGQRRSQEAEMGLTKLPAWVERRGQPCKARHVGEEDGDRLPIRHVPRLPPSLVAEIVDGSDAGLTNRASR